LRQGRYVRGDDDAEEVAVMYSALDAIRTAWCSLPDEAWLVLRDRLVEAQDSEWVSVGLPGTVNGLHARTYQEAEAGHGELAANLWQLCQLAEAHRAVYIRDRRLNNPAFDQAVRDAYPHIDPIWIDPLGGLETLPITPVPAGGELLTALLAGAARH
jgi:hypothetical protein